MNASDDVNATAYACGIFNPNDCAPGELSTEDRFLALVIIALACAICALCFLVFALVVIVFKLGTIWTAAIAKLSDQETGDAHTGLLGAGIKSSFSSRKKGTAKKASFVDDTSCATVRDVDEEDL
tara:strand:+ start:621 stop:995 length:375 start_codon:yes stop_codon:yes gene_type:complete